jgi:hypothetical protein
MAKYMSQVPPEPKPARKAAMGTMGSTYDQARERQQRLLADMRKRMMLRKDKKSN